MDIQEILTRCDHTNLSPTATPADMERLCAEAREYNMASVCVLPNQVFRCYELLIDTPIPVCTVVGFPLGANHSAVKAFEAKTAFDQGADEIDMVMDIANAKAGDWTAVIEDIVAVRTAVPEAVLKVIVETCYLTEEEKKLACAAVDVGGADFIKTSTGLGPAGATVEDVELFRSLLPEDVSIKAAGGIRTREAAEALIAAGADRIGESSLLKNLKAEGLL